MEYYNFSSLPVYSSDYFDVRIDEEMKFYVELQDTNLEFQYKMCVDEYKHLKDIIKKIGPKQVVDLGCGMGRSSVFFRQMLKMDQVKFFLCDFNRNTWRPNGENKGALGYHENSVPMPFNSLSLTERYCDYNGLTNRQILDLESKDIASLRDIDLVWSFYSVGYHWSIDKAVEQYNLLEITSPNAKFLFGVRKDLDKNNPNKHMFVEKDTKVSKYLKLQDRITGGEVFEDWAIYSKR